VAGGVGMDFVTTADAELYDPASGTWTETESLQAARNAFTATLLTNGKVLAVGGRGEDFNDDLTSAELYDVGLDFDSASQPQIDSATMTANYRLQLTGSLFQGISQASGGNYQDSSTNYPLALLRHIDNGQVTFLFADPARGWSDTSFFSLPARGFVPGPTLVTVFTNGIPSEAKYLVVPQ